jgi:hypothetical protein
MIAGNQDDSKTDIKRSAALKPVTVHSVKIFLTVHNNLQKRPQTMAALMVFYRQHGYVPIGINWMQGILFCFLPHDQA